MKLPPVWLMPLLLVAVWTVATDGIAASEATRHRTKSTRSVRRLGLGDDVASELITEVAATVIAALAGDEIQEYADHKAQYDAAMSRLKSEKRTQSEWVAIEEEDLELEEMKRQKDELARRNKATESD